MKISHAKVLITFLFYIDTAFPETIEIIRYMPKGKRINWRKGVDSVHIPQSVCYQESSGYGNYCNTSCNTDETDTHAYGRYLCTCSNDNATIVYSNNKWRCLENQEVRNQLGCEMNALFDKEQKEKQLYTLDVATKGRKTKLKRPASCAINVSSSWYIGCFGEKVPLGRDTNRTKEIFILKSGKSDKSAYVIKVNNIEPTDIFQGRVINLGIRCKSLSSSIKEGCLLFKLEGHISCNSSGPVETPTFPSFSSSIAPTTSSMETKLTASFSATKAAASVTIGPTQALTRPSSGEKQKNDDVSSSSPLGIITGVTVSMTLVLLLIAALFIYRRRCNSRKDARSSTDGRTDKNSVARNPNANSAFHLEAQNAAYVTNNDNQPFAPINNPNYEVPHQQILHGTLLNQNSTPTEENSQSDHLYAALNIPEGLNIYGPGNAQGQAYNAVQDPASHNEERFQNYGSTCTDQPVYNVLEDLSGRGTVECVNNGPNDPEPVYNVLEDPYAEVSEGPALHGATPDDDPVYNTLEETHYYAASPRTSEPVYNVLEGPFLSGAEEC